MRVASKLHLEFTATALASSRGFKVLALLLSLMACGGRAHGQVWLQTGFEGSTSLPSGWTQSQISGGATWKIQQGGEAGGGNPTAAHGGTNNATLYLANTGENKSQLISPIFNTSGFTNLSLTFWHTQALWSPDQDDLKVFHSTNGGTSWTQLAHYTSNVSTWTQRTINIPAASTSSRIAFEGNAKYGHGVCLDDIQVTGNATSIPEVSVSATDPSASEAGQATGTWTITRIGNTTGASSVNFTLSGTATQGSDYTVSPPSPVNFAAGETSKIVTLTPVDDTVGGEGDEVATLTVVSGTGYNIGVASANIGIVDDEGYDVNVLIIGSTKDSADNANMTGNSDPFNPTGIKTQLQSILDGAGLGTVNVTLVDRDTQYSLAQWFHNPLPAGDEVNNRWPNLRGELGTQWDKVILIGDPYTMEYMPGLYAYGASQIAAEVAKGTAETVLFMPWPAAGSSSTVNHYKEVVYRTGRSAGLKVAPAGLAWQSTGSTTNTTRRDFISAASLFSAIWGQSAKQSTYVYDDALADSVHTVVTSENATPQYTGNFTFQNPFLMFGDKRRDVHHSEKGTSTEDDYKNAAQSAMTRAMVSYLSSSYNDKYSSDTPEDDGLGWPVGNAMPIAWNMGRKFAETNKEYVINPAYWQIGFGYMYQANTWSLSAEAANDSQISQMFSQDLYLANFMKGQHATARCMPWRLMWAQIHQQYPTLNPLRDGSGPHVNLDLREAVGTYMYTLYSGRCPLDPKPVTMTTDWYAKKIGYETAWKLGRCQSRAPGFKVLPSAANKKSISLSSGETMSVQFIFPPQDDVTVNVSVSNPAVAMVGSKKLTFTPDNYNKPQQVKITALPGSTSPEVFQVVFQTVSNDEAYNGLDDSWEYNMTRTLSTVTRVDKPDQGKTTNRNTPATINLGVAGAASGNTTFAGPSNGSVSWSGTNVIYTPTPGSFGKDGFSFAVNTGGVLTVGYVDVTVVFGSNAAPVVNAGTDQTVTIASGGSWSPMLLGPQLWLDADDGASLAITSNTVAQWSDKSGFNRHASGPAVLAQRPIPTAGGLNGKQVLTFDGSNDQLRVDLDFLAGVSHSAFIVTNPAVFSNIYGATDSNAGANSLNVGFSSAGNYRLNHWSDTYTPAVTGNYVAGSANLLNYVWKSGVSKQIFANGKSEGINGSAGVIGTMSGGGSIGRVTGNAFFGGALSEILVLTGNVADTDRQKMEGYLAHKWGLAANLAANHPYKAAPPTGSGVTALLDGTATDADGDPMKATWSVVSAPGTLGISNYSAIDSTVVFSAAGDYTLRLTVSDGFTETSDEVVITVNNQPEVDHFAISNIASPQTVGTAITDITITAQDAANQTATSFTGSVTFGGTAGVTGTSANFVAGVLSGVSVTPLNAGSNLTLTVNDGTGHTGSKTFMVQSIYARWSGSTFSSSLTNINPSLDFDGGSLPTGIEWVVGGDPTNGADDAGLAPTIDSTGDPNGKLLFIFRRTTAAKSDANTTITVQYGDNLGTWNTALHQGNGPDNISITETPGGFGAGIDKVTVALPPSLAPNGKLFARLKVVLAVP